MGLWGVTCSQTFTFFTRNTRDGPLLKALIAFLWVLDTFDSALNCHILYFYLVTNYLNPLAIAKPIWSVIIHVAITSISNFLIRSMFAQRFYRLSKGNIIITAWIMAVSITDLEPASAGSATTTIILRHLTNALTRTDTMVNTLMMYTVNTGLIVGIDAALGMITFAVMPNNFIFLGFYLLLSKRKDLFPILVIKMAQVSSSNDSSLPKLIPRNVSGAGFRFDGSRATTAQATQSSLEKGSRADTVAISVNTLIEKNRDYTEQSPIDKATTHAY
ncbi:hypothetical protein DXG01_012172 [Tephrocybe rancida]|nr:hypothetical protein DXG01_012172 [Tephrocybe rancida]